jgi:RHH-type proline utilization regulon transcriptional repressor/proline dehydrogenase/delta 1-pyrroline-5-carboxylate dehydrogenase
MQNFSPTHKININEPDLAELYRADEEAVVQRLMADAEFTQQERDRIFHRSVELIQYMREDGKPGLMDMFLAEYGLSTNEGIALMCLAEALLRVPDHGTIDTLIEDKIAPYEWDTHFGKSQSALVNASTAALMLTGRVLDDDNSASVLGLLNRTVKRLGEPVVRVAVRRAMHEMGDQFVLGQTIEEAIRRGRAERKKGYLYSYDMLGEAALTAADAAGFFDSYAHAIDAIGGEVSKGSVQTLPGVSVKLSALHPRFEFAKTDRLHAELVPRVTALAVQACKHGIGFNIDAEEADRLIPTLNVFEALLQSPELAGWDGLGLVIQAYGKRAAATIDWLYDAAHRYNRKVMVRLVKGAYWDTEVKQSQVDGVPDFPVFTKRSATDLSYMCCAKKLLNMTDRIYPQFATHNAQTAATVLELAQQGQPFEFQRLHGMGETLHNYLVQEAGARSRIYAPVGPHKDLLAYLVRRLLENGANSSFVNQVVDRRLPAEQIALDPFEKYQKTVNQPTLGLKNPQQIYAPARLNSKGWDLRNQTDVQAIIDNRQPHSKTQWEVEPIMASDWGGDEVLPLVNPADPDDTVGRVTMASQNDAIAALTAGRSWLEADARTRASILNRASDLYETHFGELFAVLAREAGKTQLDAIAEVREAVDFLRYYANRALELPAHNPVGLVTCISPWNFPLAIFTGQIAAALAAGNGVIAKPAETTPIIASLGVKLLHEAGVPADVLQFLPGHGRTVGRTLTGHSSVGGVCFTGSTATAQSINRALARDGKADAFLIAETGGLNAAMIDSTALPEQAVRDVIASAFQSAGQRCSALRCLYVQDDVADGFLEMLFGAMDELDLGDPWELATDIGPVISDAARSEIQSYVDAAQDDGRLLKQLRVPDQGHFVGPAVLAVDSIKDLPREIFGPVLHVARFQADEFDTILQDINQTGYCLTFGLHTRIDDRVKTISDQLSVGNIYVNRNQVGAIVGSQPFGGEGLSGTGPKAGGPHYVKRFTEAPREATEAYARPTVSLEAAQAELDAFEQVIPQRLSKTKMPGPTGERNELSIWPRGLILCLGPTLEDARRQVGLARSIGCPAYAIAPDARAPDGLDGILDLECLEELNGISAVALWAEDEDVRKARNALAARPGAIIPLIATRNIEDYAIIERHTCIDTTAAGGNASLLGGGDDDVE